MPVKIDSHHHFWKYSVSEYGWIDDQMGVIRRDFLPADLRATIAEAGIDQVISVQARQSVEETEWLLGLASQESFIAGVVGWLPLVEKGVDALIAKYSVNGKLRGLRHVLQGEAEPGFMLRADFNRGIASLGRHGLTYDILILERQLKEAVQLVDLHPEQHFVLDHIAKPRIKQGELQPWLSGMKELSRRPNVWCKLSGVVTECDYRSWSEAQVLPYLEGAWECFGAGRLMFGSDWPVCLVASSYPGWVKVCERFVAKLSQSEQESFWSGNARKAYKLN